MHLLRRIAISNGDKKRKEAATAAIIEQNQDTIARWNRELENEVWRRIVATLAARGFHIAKKDAEPGEQ